LSEALKCPSSDKVCEYTDYCYAEKVIIENGGPKVNSPQEKINKMMPEEVVDLMSAYCADERILALSRLILSSSSEHLVKLATLRSDQISTSKTFFNSGYKI